MSRTLGATSIMLSSRRCGFEVDNYFEYRGDVRMSAVRLLIRYRKTLFDKKHCRDRDSSIEFCR